MFKKKKDPQAISASGIYGVFMMDEIHEYLSEIDRLEEKKVELETELNLLDEKINECRFQINEIKIRYQAEMENETDTF